MRQKGRSLCREQLEKIISKYGPVTGVVMSEKRGGSALEKFEGMTPARMAVTKFSPTTDLNTSDNNRQ